MEKRNEELFMSIYKEVIFIHFPPISNLNLELEISN